MPVTYDKIATTTLGSAQSSVTFSSISGSYTDLILVGDFTYSSLGANTGYTCIQVGNGSVDTGTNYSFTYIRGNGSSATSGKSSNGTFINLLNSASGTDQYNMIVNFQNYSNTNLYKTVLHRMGSATRETIAAVNMWRSTNSINIIKIYDYSGYNFSTGSTFTIYGVKAA